MDNSGYELFYGVCTYLSASERVFPHSCGFSRNGMQLASGIRKKKKQNSADQANKVVCLECDNDAAAPLFTTLIGVNDILYTGVKGRVINKVTKSVIALDYRRARRESET